MKVLLRYHLDTKLDIQGHYLRKGGTHAPIIFKCLYPITAMHGPKLHNTYKHSPTNASCSYGSRCPSILFPPPFSPRWGKSEHRGAYIHTKTRGLNESVRPIYITYFKGEGRKEKEAAWPGTRGKGIS